MVLLHWPCNIAEANSRLNRFPIRRNPWISRESSYWLAADLWPWLPTSGPAGCRPLARLAADLWPGWAGWPWLPTSGPAGCRPLARPGWLALAADLWPGWLPTSGPAGLAGPGCRPLARPGWLALESQNPPCRPDKVDSVISDYSVCRRLGGKALAGQCGQKTVEVIYKKAEVLWL